MSTAIDGRDIAPEEVLQSTLEEFGIDLTLPGETEFTSDVVKTPVRQSSSTETVPEETLVKTLKEAVEKHGQTAIVFVDSISALRKDFPKTAVIKAIANRLTLTTELPKDEAAAAKKKMAERLHGLAEAAAKRQLIVDVLGVSPEIMQKYDRETEVGTKDEIVKAVFNGEATLKKKRGNVDVLAVINYAPVVTVGEGDNETTVQRSWNDILSEITQIKSDVGHRKAINEDGEGEEAAMELWGKMLELSEGLRERGADDEKIEEFQTAFKTKYFVSQDIIDQRHKLYGIQNAIKAEFIAQANRLKTRFSEQWKAGQRGRVSSVNESMFDFSDSFQI